MGQGRKWSEMVERNGAESETVRINGDSPQLSNSLHFSPQSSFPGPNGEA